VRNEVHDHSAECHGEHSELGDGGRERFAVLLDPLQDLIVTERKPTARFGHVISSSRPAVTPDILRRKGHLRKPPLSFATLQPLSETVRSET
jgi:hypothetical protein